MGCLFSKNAWVSDLLHTSAPFRLVEPYISLNLCRRIENFEVFHLDITGDRVLIMGDVWRCIGIPNVRPFKFEFIWHSFNQRAHMHWYRNGVKEKSVYAFIENGQKRYWYWTERTGWVNVSGSLRQWITRKVLRRVVPDDLARLVIEYGDHP